LYPQTLTQLDFVQHPTYKLYPNHLADLNITSADLSSRRGKQLSAAGKEENTSFPTGYETKARINITLPPVFSLEVNVIKHYQNYSVYLNSIVHFCDLIQSFQLVSELGNSLSGELSSLRSL